MEYFEVTWNLRTESKESDGPAISIHGGGAGGGGSTGGGHTAVGGTVSAKGR